MKKENYTISEWISLVLSVIGIFLIFSIKFIDSEFDLGGIGSIIIAIGILFYLFGKKSGKM